MKIITSKNNPIVINSKKIKDKPEGKLFLENPKLVEEAFLNNIDFDYILIDFEKQKDFKKKYPFLFNFKIFLINKIILKYLCDTQTPQGIIAIVNFRPKTLLKPKGNFLVLENLQDPGNLGTIIRSAGGTDFKDIFLINCAGICNQKLLRSTMGSLFKVNLYTFLSSEAFLNFSIENDLKLFRADFQGKNLFEMDLPNKNFGIVIGNEGKGISKLLKDNIKNIITIPMKNGVESLNAGVSCSIIIYYLDNLKKSKESI